MEGARLAYVQSDEISILLTDFGSAQTESWFDSSIQKIASISASVATARFNQLRQLRAFRSGGDEQATSPIPESELRTKLESLTPAHFDSRVFTIPDFGEVLNYFIWRQQDATRNSVSMTAQAHFDHKSLQRLSTDELQEMLFQERGVNWSSLPTGFKRGRCVVKESLTENRAFIDKRTGEEKIAVGVQRTRWAVTAPPTFTKHREWLTNHIPRPEV